MLGIRKEFADLFTITEKNDCSLGQRDVRSRAIKELNAKLLLKRLDLQAHGRLCKIQSLGGLAKAEMFRYFPKDH
jgi:hypothetical protein